MSQLILGSEYALNGAAYVVDTDGSAPNTPYTFSLSKFSGSDMPNALYQLGNDTQLYQAVDDGFLPTEYTTADLV